ncbi:MAG: hypothetical protein RAP70_05110 [Candidatus Celaenobacter antarcticus]|nr:hypothetical protein [Candidatus Celaenobacter antarcticus]
MEKNKKLRAAIAGVLQFLTQEEENNKQGKNQWVMAGRKMIMHNRILVQRRELKR